MRNRDSLKIIALKTQVISTHKSIVWLLILLASQLIIASICYWIYYYNPKSYVVGDEISSRYIEITRANHSDKLKSIEMIEADTKKNLEIAHYIRDSSKTFTSSNDRTLFLNDSLIIVLSKHNPQPDMSYMLIKIYSKKKLTMLDDFITYVPFIDINNIITGHIKHLEEKMVMIKADLNNISGNSSNYRWSYIHFLSYYFREQLQAMSPLLIIVDFLKYLIWLAISILLSSPLWNKRSSSKKEIV